MPQKDVASPCTPAVAPAGPLLQDWSAFHKLRIMRLYNNRLSGPLPQRLPPNIEEMQLHRNYFEGTRVCMHFRQGVPLHAAGQPARCSCRCE